MQAHRPWAQQNPWVAQHVEECYGHQTHFCMRPKKAWHQIFKCSNHLIKFLQPYPTTSHNCWSSYTRLVDPPSILTSDFLVSSRYSHLLTAQSSVLSFNFVMEPKCWAFFLGLVTNSMILWKNNSQIFFFKTTFLKNCQISTHGVSFSDFLMLLNWQSSTRIFIQIWQH